MEYVINSVVPNDFWNFVSAFALNLKYCMFQNVSKIIELFPLWSYFSIIYSILVLLLRDCRLVKTNSLQYVWRHNMYIICYRYIK